MWQAWHGDPEVLLHPLSHRPRSLQHPERGFVLGSMIPEPLNHAGLRSGDISLRIALQCCGTRKSYGRVGREFLTESSVKLCCSM